MWFWQMEGRRWPLDGRSFDVASRAWQRLAASASERQGETDARYERDHAAVQLEHEERERTVKAE